MYNKTYLCLVHGRCEGVADMGVKTVTRSVLGDKQNSYRNLDILPGIGRLRIFSGKYDIVLGHCRKKVGY